MKKKIILSFFIGGILTAFFELLSLYRQDVFSTHETHPIVIMIITAFMEGSFLLLVFAWRNKLQFQTTWRCFIFYIGLLLLYYYIRGITVTFSLFFSTLLSAFSGLLIFKIIGIKISMEFVGMAFTVFIDVILLFLVFYPLLTFGNRWLVKGEKE